MVKEERIRGSKITKLLVRLRKLMQLSKAETVVSNQKIRRRKRGEEGKT